MTDPVAESNLGVFKSGDKVLVVGDGNLTFSLSLAQNLNNIEVYATTYLSLLELYESYGKDAIVETINKLNSISNVKVFH